MFRVDQMLPPGAVISGFRSRLPGTPQEEKLLEYPELFNTPIVRNGKEATVGYCPDVWAKWE